MAISLPPAVSVTRFQGGYRSISSYSDLADGETSDAENTVYGPGNDINQRLGSLRLYNRLLFSTSATSTGRPITGHYYFAKLGSTNTYHVVAAGDSLYNYTSSTANPIMQTLTDNSNTFWDFVQVQDPRTPADDIIAMTNGSNPIQVWNGTATAVALSSFTSATQVPICKYLLNHKERIYAVNIIDATDADAAVKVFRTGFGSDGAADPHRFTENFYVGGSSKDGDIRGTEVLNEQIVFYKRQGVWKFNPGSGDTNDLLQIEDQIGLFAPLSLINAGNVHIFLSEQGVFLFDGSSFTHLSKDVDDLLLKQSNTGQLQYSKAVFDKKNRQYKLYFPLTGSDRNNCALIYDFRIKAWQPPVTGRQVSFLSTFVNSSDNTNVIYGDYFGYLYADETGNNDGVSTGYNGTATGGGASTLTHATAAFSTTGDGLAGLLIKIISGTGSGQSRIITSNTATQVTVETPWATIPNSTSVYTIGAIDSYWRSKDFSFGQEDIVKMFRLVRPRCREEGAITLTIQYIIDFAQLQQATSYALLLYDDGFVWDRSRWDQTRWGGRDVLNHLKVPLRASFTQSINGTHIALRFSNSRANDRWRLSGFDIENKSYGKR